MVRLIILVLIIIGGIWMFRACENDGEKVEFTTKEQKNERAEKPDSRESKDSQEEKSSNTEDKEDGEATTLIGKEEGSDTENEKDVDGEAEKKDLENSTEVDTNSGDAKTT